jgi:CheY-like chemotaxis protein
LLTIINDILDFSKIEAGRMELDPASFNLQTALEEVVTLVSTKVDSQKMELSLRYDPNLPAGFIGDEGRIRQVVTNIIGNAVKFTLEGHVLVNVSGIVTGDSCKLQIAVEDTGIGIPKEKIQGIFNAFEQVDGAANRQFQGTGLGLAISTRFVNLMGGTISATSEIGKGSIFTIEMNLQTSAESEEIQPDIPTNLEMAKVLIVDDLEINRTILGERLRCWKIPNVSTGSGTKALELLAQAHESGAPYDLVVLDFQMPEMDGEQLATKIRGNSNFGSIPLIVLSSVDQSFEVAVRKRLGISDVLLKPVRANKLRLSLTKALAPSANTKTVIAPTAVIVEPTEIPPIHILIAEDNKTNQLVVKTMLKKTTATYTIANNGREAVDIFLETSPDLVLMDVSMPEMDGLEATTQIRLLEAKHNRHRVPIVALTANAMNGDRERCIGAGMDDYLSKPMKKAKLFETLLNWSRTVPMQEEKEAQKQA